MGEQALLKHMDSKAHKAAQEKLIGFMDPGAQIDNKIEKWSDEDRCLYKIRLKYTLRCLKFLLHQGLAFWGHDESEESSNRGNFIELLKFLAANSYFLVCWPLILLTHMLHLMHRRYVD